MMEPTTQLESADLLSVLQRLADDWPRHIRRRVWNTRDIDGLRLNLPSVVASAFGQSQE